MIEPFVRHNLSVLDRMIVLDHGSVDDTRSILDRLASETGRVAVASARGFGFDQSGLMTGLLHRMQAALAADYVLALDADEFLAVTDRAAMLRAFEAITVGGAALIPWRTYVLTGRRGEADDPPRSLRHRRAAEVPRYRKVVLRFDGAPASDIVIERGSHIAHSVSTGAIPLPDLAGVALIHVPFRSADQFEGKAVVRFMSRYGGMSVGPDSGVHMRAFRQRYDQVAFGTRPVPSDVLSDLSAGYAQDVVPSIVCDPVLWSYVRRFSDGRPLSPVALIARSWERSLLDAAGDGEADPDELGEALRSISGSAQVGVAIKACADPDASVTAGRG